MSKKPTKEERNRWNRKIRNACRQDYKSWVTRWVEKIERADNKGDTKAVSQGVKVLSRAKSHCSKCPTEHYESKENTQETDESKREENKAEADIKETPGVSKDTHGNSKCKDGKPPVRARRGRLSGPEELAEVWNEFLGKTFSATGQEKLRSELKELSECDDPDVMLTRKEFEDAVKSKKNGKVVGRDKIPAEV